MSLPFITTLLLITYYYVARGNTKVTTQIIPDNDFQGHCRLNLNGYEYNLCPLAGSTRAVEVPELVDGEGKSLNDAVYLMILGGQSMKNIDVHCGEDTWVCISDNFRNVKDSHGLEVQSTPVSLFKNVEGSRVSFIQDIVDHDTSRLRMMLQDGTLPQFIEITFFCSVVDDLTFVKVYQGTHSFKWFTPHVCPKKRPTIKSTFNALQNTGADGLEEPTKDDNKGNDELIPSESRKARRWVALAIVLLVLTFVCGSILASSSRARYFIIEHLRTGVHAFVPILYGAAIKLQPIGQSFKSLVSKILVPFRQGDGTLVQWAQEDMALEAEDLMVNGTGSYDAYDVSVEGWEGDGWNEYIPLAPSPKGRRARNYGSTPDVESFEERGAIGGIGRFLGK